MSISGEEAVEGRNEMKGNPNLHIGSYHSRSNLNSFTFQEENCPDYLENDRLKIRAPKFVIIKL